VRGVTGGSGRCVLTASPIEGNPNALSAPFGTIEGGAEPLEEGDGAELRVGTGAGTAVSQGGPNGAEEDPEHGPGDGRVVVEEGADPPGNGEHPLADRQRRQDVIVQVGGDLDHPPGIAGRADAPAFAGEGHEALGGAVVTPDAGEAVGEDAAAQVGRRGSPPRPSPPSLAKRPFFPLASTGSGRARNAPAPSGVHSGDERLFCRVAGEVVQRENGHGADLGHVQAGLACRG
jgi:hypothetical protein